MFAKPTGDMPRLTPHLFYDDVGGALDFLVTAFGFEVKLRMKDDGGKVVHGEVQIGDSLVMIGLTEENPDWECPRTLSGKISQRLYVFVDDVDAHYQRACGAGVKIHRHPEDQFYGDRVYECIDHEGHRWKFAQHLFDVDNRTLQRP
jgi:PhnB protein